MEKRGKKVKVTNRFQKNYVYYLTEKPGKNFDKEFKPDLTPKRMLELGVFEGFYDSVNPKEFPKSWFAKAKTSKEKNVELNYFKVDASQPLSIWRKKKWVCKEDPQGWFLWYCRYYMGRRIEKEDQRQIKRWKAMQRHVAQIKKNCKKGDLECRKKQRQALLHWAIDSRKL